MIEYSSESGQILPDSIAPTADEFSNLPLNAIAPSLTNPRKTFDAVKLAELADSIKASGVHQPVLVRPLPGSRVYDTFGIHGPDGRLQPRPVYELVAGERRYRACKLAGVATIPALIRNLTDHQVLEIQIIENLQRDDLSALEEAEGYEQLCRETAITKEDVGTKIGKSRAYVYARIKLLDLSQDCKQGLRDGAIDTSRALLIARIPDMALQQKALIYAITKTGYDDSVPSLRLFQTWLQKNVMLRLDSAPFNVTDNQLCKDAGSCKDCQKRTGANPDLFSDVDSADICTDPPCYQAKDAAHHAQLIARAEAKGMRVIDGKEAVGIFKEHFGFPMTGYSRLDQRRNDAGEADAPTLRKLLGNDVEDLKAQGVEFVLIENPRTKELIEAVSTAETEALLITRGLIQQTRAAERTGADIDRLKKDIDTRVLRESRPAIFAALVKDVHASPAEAVDNLVSADLLRAWLLSEIDDRDAEDIAIAINYSVLPEDGSISDDGLRMCIQRLPTSGLWKALSIIMAMNDRDVYGFARQNELIVFDALAKTTGTDIAQVVKDTRDTIKTEVAEQIKTIKAKVQADKSPKPVLPLADVAISKGEGGAKTKPKKPKTTAAEAQAAIAAAMQAQDQTQTTESEDKSGAAVASQGMGTGSGFALPVGTATHASADTNQEINIGAAVASQGNEQAATARPEALHDASEAVEVLYATATSMVVIQRHASISRLQRVLCISYTNAECLLERMGEEGIVARQPDGTFKVLAPSPIPATDDPLYQPALDLIRKENKANVRLLKEGLKVGTSKALELMDMLEQEGHVSACNERGARAVLVAA